LMTAKPQPVVIAAGGTGGHVFPAQALAGGLLARGEQGILGTDKRFAQFNHGVFTRTPLRTIRARTLGGSPVRRIFGLANIVLGIAQAAFLLQKLRPRVVVGFGGYPSFPTMVAATKLRIPTVIHEQNSVLGRANRWLAPRVGHIATSFSN